MFYHLYNFLKEHHIHIPGLGVMQYITFRLILAVIFSLLIATIFGRSIINFLVRKQIGESVRDLGLDGQKSKSGTPTMGGIIILISILIPTLLFANLNKVYIRLMLLSTVWLGFIGFLDDYFKLKARKKAKELGAKYQKKDSDGLAAKSKLIGQLGLGLVVGLTLYFSNAVTVYREVYSNEPVLESDTPNTLITNSQNVVLDSNKFVTHIVNGKKRKFAIAKTPITTLPFVKNHEFNYVKFVSWIHPSAEKYTWLIYTIIITFIIMAVSNGANLTDGIDGLAAGVSLIIGLVLGIFVYISGNIVLADYLNISYIPNLGEVSIFIAALIGACIGFLWYNAYPAQVFMGDTGSLALGGIIAVLAIIVRKEFLIPIICFVFLIENLSVIIQVTYFKYTKRKYGEGKRVFLMSPLHHHFQKKGIPENKIVIRFWIITFLCVVISILTLKIR
ncbi:MAG: phospho-N-acetylmuramoyl-pentapeptide-transferase [Alphaproteobacteria bacterium]|nr:phospho-N-acetylmuramoyl-pentapeptide-transferase [Alphaproteobacteria bacterium]